MRLIGIKEKYLYSRSRREAGVLWAFFTETDKSIWDEFYHKYGQIVYQGSKVSIFGKVVYDVQNDTFTIPNPVALLKAKTDEILQEKKDKLLSLLKFDMAGEIWSGLWKSVLIVLSAWAGLKLVNKSWEKYCEIRALG
jgi:hypothetical protein